MSQQPEEGKQLLHRSAPVQLMKICITMMQATKTKRQYAKQRMAFPNIP